MPFRKIFKYKWKILAFIALLLLCYMVYFFLPVKEYKFDDGKYSLILQVKDENGNVSEGVGTEYLVTLKGDKISFTDTRYGEEFFKGTLSKNKLSAKYKKYVEDAFMDDRYSSPSYFDKTIEVLTFNTIRFTPYTKITVSGSLIADNKITGTYYLADKYGNNDSCKFKLIPSDKISQKKIYPYLAVGNGTGPMIKLIDPRTVEIYFPAKEKFIIDKKEYMDYESLGKRIQESVSQFGTDIPVALYFNKNLLFKDMKKNIDFIKSNNLYKFEFRYFWDENWDGITMFKFDSYPYERSSNVKKVKFIEIKCFSDNKYKVLMLGDLDIKPLKEKLNISQLKSFIDRVCKADLARTEKFDFKIEDDVTLQELVEVLELMQYIRSKGFAVRFMEQYLEY